MNSVLIVLLILVAVGAALAIVLAVMLGRGGRRSYQRYSGLEQQRASAKRSRESGADRLRTAEQALARSQRAYVTRGEHDNAQALEPLRRQLSTLETRLRHATYGYAPLGAANPVREDELAALQDSDAEMMLDAEAIADLALQLPNAVSAGESPDLDPLRAASDRLEATLDRRGHRN